MPLRCRQPVCAQFFVEVLPSLFGKEDSGETATETRTSATEAAQPPVLTHEAQRPGAAESEAIGPYGNVGFNLAHTIAHRIGHGFTEVLFIGIALFAAGAGMVLGWLFYVKDTRLPDIWANRLRPLYEASYNKYWVDEFYGWAITRRTMDLARAVYAFDSKVVDGAVNGTARLSQLSARITGGIDKYFVDGLVNAIAAFVIRLMSPLIRAAQTGLAQNYALMMVIGLLVAVAAFFYSDILLAVRGH